MAQFEKIVKNADFRTILGFCISALLLWLTFHNSGLKVNSIRLLGFQWVYFISAVILFVFSIWVYSVRAKLIWSDTVLKPRIIDTYSSLVIGSLYNSLLPGKLGEGIRAWHYSKKQHVTFSRSLAAIVVEKWVDAQIFVPIALILFSLKPFISHYVSFTIGYTVLTIISLFIIYSIMTKNKAVEKKIWKMIVSVKRPGIFLFKVYKHTLQHISNIKMKEATFRYLALCAIIFFLNVLQFFFLLKAANIAEPVAGIYTACIIAISMMIIAFIPSAPGNIGVLHYGLYSVLLLSASQHGIKPNGNDLQTYALFGVYAHLSCFIPELLIGGFFAIIERKFLFGIKS